MDSTIDNRCCHSCGLIFNAGGVRGFTKEFYTDSYRLLMCNPGAQVQYYSGSEPISLTELTHRVLHQFIDLEPSGSILEVGAGKGDFLSRFVADYPAWTVQAFEPSGTFEVLRERLPDAEVGQCDYGDLTLREGSVDLVVALGVLEHVNDPLDLLHWARRVLRPRGSCFLRMPNFSNNPNDLFCADHLSKLTVETLRYLAAAAGFKMTHCRQAGMPMLAMLQKTDDTENVDSVFESNLELASRNVSAAKRSIEAVLAARNAALGDGRRFAIFGLASAGLFAPFFNGFDSQEITAYIDENESLWGCTVLGRPVGGLDLIQKLDIHHVAVPISPIYIEKVSAKLAAHGVQVYAPELPR